MALNLQAAKINAAVSSEGRWVMLSEGGEVLVARWDNPAFRSLQTKLQPVSYTHLTLPTNREV